MRWVCPGCGSQVSVALSVCPNCGSSEASEPAESRAAALVTPREVKPTEFYLPPPAERTSLAVAPPVAKPPTQRLLPTPRAAARNEMERENPFWRGVKIGIGFMLAVVMILLLLALLLPWLREKGWQPWLDSAAP